MKAELPINEILRLKALHDLAILDTPREQNFDDIAQVAMQVCDVPIAVVSLVDKDRQWFKSCLGLDASETPRDVAFCAHAILVPDEVLVVEDATQDVRFIDNGLVTGAPYIRFYAGAPLVTPEGMALGTLCVIDYKPRTLTESQFNSLKALARQVIQLLRLKATNDAVKEYSARVQLIADKVPVLIGEINADGIYEFVNQRHKDWLGINLEDVIGKTPNSIFPEEYKDAINEAVKCALAGEKSSAEVQLANGKILDVSYLPKMENNRVTGVFEVAVDVTERKIHLQVMQKERARLASIIDGTNIGTWEWNVNQNTVVINERWANMLGYELADVEPVTVEVWAGLLHPDDSAKAYESLNKHLSGEAAFHDCEFRMRKKNGDWHWVHAHGKIVSRNADGSPELISGMHMDINEAKNTYEKLKERDLERQIMTSKLTQLFEMAPIGIMQIHEGGKFLDTNPEFSKITGYTRDELRGLTFLDITPEEDLAKSQIAAQELKDKGRFGPFEKNYVNKQGELVPVEVSGSKIDLGDGQPPSWWTLVKDIREQKRMERMKSEFISTVSHELRTPLTSISGALGLITNSMLGALPDKVQGMLDIAYKNSQRLTLLINDLLDMEKLLAGKMFFEMRPQLITPLVEQAMLENKTYADKYKVKLRLHNQAQNARANLDAFRFQQVLNNFLSNAAKYSPADNYIDITVSQLGDWVRVSVRDYGQGIPEEFKARIFQKFSQADSSDTRQKGGTGLGLAISKELMERMGGKIGFESSAESGTCFYAEFLIENQ